MDLAKTQKILAQLYTNSGWRRRFFADPQETSRALGLSVAAAEALAKLSAPQVNFFAGSLQRKRFNEVCKLLPLTQRMMGERFGALFKEYAEANIPQGIKIPREETLAFANYIKKHGSLETRWSVELLRYEMAWLETTKPDCRFIIRGFHYAIEKLVESFSKKYANQPALLKQPTLMLWFRLSRQGRLRRLVLSLPFGRG